MELPMMAEHIEPRLARPARAVVETSSVLSHLWHRAPNPLDRQAIRF
jgi:hypothetical protein